MFVNELDSRPISRGVKATVGFAFWVVRFNIVITADLTFHDREHRASRHPKCSRSNGKLFTLPWNPCSRSRGNTVHHRVEYALFCTAKNQGAHFLLRTYVDRLTGDSGHTIETEIAETRCKGLHRIEVRAAVRRRRTLKLRSGGSRCCTRLASRDVIPHSI
jgi:hypothetical protein